MAERIMSIEVVRYKDDPRVFTIAKREDGWSEIRPPFYPPKTRRRPNPPDLEDHR